MNEIKLNITVQNSLLERMIGDNPERILLSYPKFIFDNWALFDTELRYLFQRTADNIMSCDSLSYNAKCNIKQLINWMTLNRDSNATTVAPVVDYVELPVINPMR